MFFTPFPNELHEWLSKSVNNEPSWKHDDPIVWNPKLIKHLGSSNYKVARDINYWIDSILGRFITEFSIDRSIS